MGRHTRSRALRPAILFAAGVLLLSACSSAHAHEQTAPSTTTTASATSASVPCRPKLTPGGHDLTMTVGGRIRTLIVHVPAVPAHSNESPLVVDMHGSGSTAAQQEIVSGMNTAADAAGFVVVYPQAIIPSGSGFVWNIPGVPLIGGGAVPAHAADDIAYIEAVVAKLHTSACVDLSRVYATGLSGGARLSSQLGCDAASTFAAIAPVAGLRLPTPCPATRAVPVIAFHGTADPVDPYEGNGQAYWTYSVPVAAQRWSAHDACAAAPKTSQPVAAVTLTAYTGCRDGAIVELYTLTGEGHEWPGGPTLPAALTHALGPQSNAIDADQLMLAFFTAHPMP